MLLVQNLLTNDYMRVYVCTICLHIINYCTIKNKYYFEKKSKSFKYTRARATCLRSHLFQLHMQLQKNGPSAPYTHICTSVYILYDSIV